MNARDYERARSALAFIPSDDRDLWVSMGMAIKDGFGDEGFALWDAWSRQSDRYNERDARDVWRSIKAGGGITLGTLFHEAKARSWRDDRSRHRKKSKPGGVKLPSGPRRRKRRRAGTVARVATIAVANPGSAKTEGTSAHPDDDALWWRVSVREPGGPDHRGR